METSNIAYLRVTTWKEALGYASHYYGYIDLNNKTPDIDVKKRLTSEEAKAMWKADKRRGEKKPIWKEGDNCGAFLEEKVLFDTAKKMLPEGFNALVVGTPYTLEPQPIIWAKKKFTRHKNRINQLYKLAEEVGWWDGDEEKMGEINKEWEKLFEEIKNG